MSCISSNFSSFFLNSLNDSSEFAKYLSNGELKFSSFEDFQVFGSGAGTSTSPPPSTAAVAASSSSLSAQQAPAQQQQQQQYYNGIGNSGHNNANISAGANTAGLPSGIEQPYNNGVAAMNSIGNCGTETANTAALTPANASNSPQPGVQQLQHGAHLHTTHHIPHPTHLPHPHPHAQHPYAGHAPHTPGSLAAPTNAFHHHNHLASPHLAQGMPTAATPNYPTTPQRWATATGASSIVTASPGGAPHPISQLQNSNQPDTPIAPNPSGAQHFDGSFEFLKYLRHSNDYNNSEPQGDAAAGTASAGQAQASSASSLIDLDSSTSHKSRSSRKAAALLSSVSRTSNSLDANALDVFDHDSKHTIFDVHHITATNSSNSNESSLEISNLAFPSSHLNASNSNTSSEGAATGSSDFAMLHSSSAASAPKPLASFTITDNFDVHPSHKVEEGIFQHMNKLPAKKKENLKQLGVRFTGQMTLSDKSIVVENFIKFCQEYDVQDHRPFLSLNQSGLNKADQIKFARYLGQGLPTFTLFCIYSNFKNLFCTKRTEIYTKDGYNLPYILDKTKRFLSNTTAGNTSSKSNPSSSHSQSQPQSLSQSQPQSQQQQQPPPHSQQQPAPQTQQQQHPPQLQQQQNPPQLQQQQIAQSQLLQQQQQQLPQTHHQQYPTQLQQQQQPTQFQQQQTHTLQSIPLQSQPLQLKPLQAHPMQAYPLQSLSLQSQQLQPHPLQSQSPQIQSLAAAHQLRPQSPHAQPMQPRPLQSQILQPHPIQQQPLQPHPYQSQPLQQHPLQSQPLQPQPPKTLPTQTHPQLMLQTPSSPLPPAHIQQLQLQQQQQQQQLSPLHIPMSMSRGLSK